MAFRSIRRLLFALALSFGLCGCGGSSSPAAAPGYAGGAGDRVTVSADSNAAPPEPMEEGSGETLSAGTTGGMPSPAAPARAAPPPPAQSLSPAKKEARFEAESDSRNV